MHTMMKTTIKTTTRVIASSEGQVTFASFLCEVVRAKSSRPAKVRSKTLKEAIFTFGNPRKISDWRVSSSSTGRLLDILSRKALLPSTHKM